MDAVLDGGKKGYQLLGEKTEKEGKRKDVALFVDKSKEQEEGGR